MQGQGQTIAQMVKQLGITEQTFCRWRKEYGGMRVDQAKRLKELEAENTRLKRVVAESNQRHELQKRAEKDCKLTLRTPVLPMLPISAAKMAKQGGTWWAKVFE